MKLKYIFYYLSVFIALIPNVVYCAAPNNYSDFNFSRIIFSIISFIIVLVLTYFVTKFIASRNVNMANKSNIIIKDYVKLNNSCSIYIISINKKNYVLGVSNNNVNLIDKLKENEIEFTKNSTHEKLDFKNYLNSIIHKDKNNFNNDLIKRYNLQNLKEKIDIIKDEGNISIKNEDEVNEKYN